MLELKNLRVSYKGVEAIHNLSMRVTKSSVVTLLGGNGAGKTTVLKTISGLISEKTGEIHFEGRNIGSFAPERIVRMGIVQVPEGRQIFPLLTVKENLTMGAYTRRDKEGITKDMERIFSYFPILSERKSQMGGTLSGGEQQMLSIGRGLMAGPKLLLLDEPSLGLAPLVVKEIFRITQTINQDAGITILLVEQNAKMAFSISTYGYVLGNGRILVEGESKGLLESTEVQKAYLGGPQQKIPGE